MKGAVMVPFFIILLLKSHAFLLFDIIVIKDLSFSIKIEPLSP